MTYQPGTFANPLRVAIIGSGPAGFYLAEQLFKQKGLAVEIDMFDRLPTPFGLVRGGVAPDHPKIKTVTRAYDRIASSPSFRFYGNVTVGEDLTRADLTRHYHAIVYAVGAQTDRKLGIPGEDLSGSHAATDFVGWYNGHPDYTGRRFDLNAESVAVIGNGNVAMDVVRILARTPDELCATDIADYALDALRRSRVKTIYMLGRRGPAQAAFTNPELKELEELGGAEVHVDPAELVLDPLTEAMIEMGADRSVDRNLEILRHYSELPVQGKPKTIDLRFLVSPVEILGTTRVEAIRVVKNELYRAGDGSLRSRPTGEYETLPVGLVFRSIGYRGVALPGVPFDTARGIIPNRAGRVTDLAGAVQPGEYAVGWIKRGPTGIIGTNKPDAQETAQQLIADVAENALLHPASPSRGSLEALLHAHNVRYVTYQDWQILDRLEQERGQRLGRPRVKFCRVEEMLAALAEATHETETVGSQ
ncbi:FAD-dependent oxidoreductase [Aggregatilinea lenta]|uniref:FAD-dependent oxidoreductase n=1 Tax=Aggregatilinea lenta TaxID=913108 RepID=UPI000E5C5058|nr:FAD-dependent oxidoreductase [Aggregatilinea lenta]